MLLIIKYIAKLLKALSSEASPSQIAGGVILGMIIGLTPIASFHNLIIVVLIIILKVNIGMAILGFFVFSGVAYLADPLFHSIGTSILENQGLQATFTSMYDSEWWAMTRFYNTVVIGSFISAVILSIPMFPVTIFGVNQYRDKVHAKVQKWKIVKALKGSKVYSIYQTVNRVRS
ncbi:MAG: TIGR03546 family protein [Balneolaceae bacterium]